MIRYGTLGILVGILFTASQVSAGPVLLASFTQESGLASPSPTLQIGFVLGLYEEFSQESVLLGTDQIATTWPYFQPLEFWGKGETGILEFTPTNDIGFSVFAQRATDGLDHRFVIFNSWESYAQGGQGGRESGLFSTTGDLFGYTLDSIRLKVDEISFIPQGSLGPEWHWNITFEFFGSPIVPEPSTFLLVITLILLPAYRKRTVRQFLGRDKR